MTPIWGNHKYFIYKYRIIHIFNNIYFRNKNNEDICIFSNNSF